MLEKLQLSGTSVAETMTDLLKKIPGAEKFAEFLGDKMNILLVVGLVLAILGCFLGYKLKRVFHAVYLSAGFAAIGAAIASLLKLPNLALILAAVGSACIGVLLGIFLHKAAFAARMLVVSTAGLYAVCCIWNQPLIGLIDGFALGLALVILAGAYEKGIAVFYTSLAGAMEAALLLDALELVSLPGVVYVLVGAVLCVAGVAIQFRLNRDKNEKPANLEEKNEQDDLAEIIIMEVPKEEGNDEEDVSFAIADEVYTSETDTSETDTSETDTSETDTSEKEGKEEIKKEKFLFCLNCGSKFGDGEKFCKQCGAKRG